MANERLSLCAFILFSGFILSISKEIIVVGGKRNLLEGEQSREPLATEGYPHTKMGFLRDRNSAKRPMRTPLSKRSFISSEVEKFLLKAGTHIHDQDLLELFRNTLPNSLDTTINYQFDKISNLDDTWIITGDIDRMWQRDSCFQVMPYLDFAKRDARLRAMIRGAVNRQMRNIISDPYTCAFNRENSGGSNPHDNTGRIIDGKLVLERNPNVNSRKFEVDSLAAPLFLSMKYYEKVKDLTIFSPIWFRGLDVILKTCRAQQRSSKEEDLAGDIPYYFNVGDASWYDNLSRGRGRPSRRTGMVKSAFRPSDDQGMLPFNVAGNAMLSVSLGKVAEVLRRIGPIKFERYIKECDCLSKEIKEGIMKFGLITRPDGRQVFASEVDGFGGTYFADDPNIPNVLSLPYLGFIARDHPLYLETRKELLDPNFNTYFYKDERSHIEGSWSPHVFENSIWPMSIIMRAFTSNNDTEIKMCLEWLKSTHGGTYLIHETFDPVNPKEFTREWFGWGNSLFAEFILHLMNDKPHLLREE